GDSFGRGSTLDTRDPHLNAGDNSASGIRHNARQRRAHILGQQGQSGRAQQYTQGEKSLHKTSGSMMGGSLRYEDQLLDPHIKNLF
ncbi:MAG: hypothetical protein QM757_27290, partial [Paludibaculum sp.]